MTRSKVTVLPVPTSGPGGREDTDLRALLAENERLRSENAVLRERLANVQAIALEREQRIEDLTHALRMLPSEWARKLDAGKVEEAARSAEPPPASSASVDTGPEATGAVADASEAPSGVTEPPATAAPEPPAAAASEPPLDPAEAVLKEVAALRARLERRRLDVEREMLEQERRKIAADLDWTRKWRRFRRARAALP